MSNPRHKSFPIVTRCRFINKTRIIQDGAIEFSNNTSQDSIWAMPTLSILPQVGEFFIFPSTQRHLVYPFRTPDGKGERRSVSFNADFTKYVDDTYIENEEIKKEGQHYISRSK